MDNINLNKIVENLSKIFINDEIRISNRVRIGAERYMVVYINDIPVSFNIQGDADMNLVTFDDIWVDILTKLESIKDQIVSPVIYGNFSRPLVKKEEKLSFYKYMIKYFDD